MTNDKKKTALEQLKSLSISKQVEMANEHTLELVLELAEQNQALSKRLDDMKSGISTDIIQMRGKIKWMSERLDALESTIHPSTFSALNHLDDRLTALESANHPSMPKDLVTYLVDFMLSSFTPDQIGQAIQIVEAKCGAAKETSMPKQSEQLKDYVNAPFMNIDEAKDMVHGDHHGANLDFSRAIGVLESYVQCNPTKVPSHIIEEIGNAIHFLEKHNK